MADLKLIWVDDKPEAGPSIEFRVEPDLTINSHRIVKSEYLENGQYLIPTIRQINPSIILMDHNLNDIERNGAVLIAEVRLHFENIPIIYYSTEMNEAMKSNALRFNSVYPIIRDDVAAELLRIVKIYF